ncbi:MAG: hypothetical protein R2873_27130 [Caldilineaceae bacterium]
MELLPHRQPALYECGVTTELVDDDGSKEFADLRACFCKRLSSSTLPR